MSAFDRAPGRSSGASTDAGASAGVAPGKRTLTEGLTVQRKADGGASSQADVHASAAKGIALPSVPLPHGEAIQQSFGPGFDVSSIRAHVGGAAAEASRDIGASAYATGGDVAFREAPDLHTSAHEAAHVVQQAQGVSLYGGVGEAGDAHEQQADAVADRVVAGQSAADLLGAAPGAPAAAGPVQRKEDAKEPPDPVLDPLVRGECAGSGKGTDLGYTYVFLDSTMDAAFKKLCAHWGIPLFPAIDGGDKTAAKPKTAGGDSAGHGVAKLPAWFNTMQNKVIGATSWGRTEKAGQAFLEAFLRANFPDAPSSVNVFFHHVGKSETNKASNEMVPGSTSSNIWCQGASTLPIVQALHDAGYRFKARTSPRAMPWASLTPGTTVKAGDAISAGHQDLLYSLWVGDNPGKAPESGTPPPARMIGLPAAASAPLEPGDIISLVTSGTPSSGHVGTIVELKEPAITMVSGNAGGAAAGQGAIRIEDVPREPLPPGAYWDQTGKIKTPGVTVPAKPGVCWVVSVQKTSQLDPKRLEALDEAALTNLGLEKQAVTVTT